ncbi:MAG: hypothetical protein E7039_08405 [Lentisphaerae bacterium]|nr:hypothetical protein [Lentisphaerota bacterium]
MFKIFSTLFTIIAAMLQLPAQYIPNSRYAGKLDPTPVKMPKKHPSPKRELRGVWVATIFNLDYQRPDNVNEFKSFYRNMCKRLAEHKFNAVFFQVRPSNDAFYRSKLNPWSRFLSGKEGVPLAGDKNFDPLTFMISEAHRHGLEFHAWLNPYRVIGATKSSKHQYLKTLAPNNFARKYPHLVMDVIRKDKQHALVLNPGEKQVRNFVTATVMEIVSNYNVDSIHFDDYFYPDNAPANVDRATYLKNNPRKLSQDDWRRNNVTTLIHNINSQIKSFNRRSKRNVRFGVSPFGIWRNNNHTLLGSMSRGAESYTWQYADTRLWIKHKMIDYIVPQIYWHFNHDTAPYAALTDWWCKTVQNSGVDLYIGQAAYQLGQKNWDCNQLYYQLLYNRSKPQIKGSIIFSYRNLATPENRTMEQGARQMLKHFWK